jgi:pantothenate kinase
MNLADNAERIASATLERAGDRERFIIALAGPPGVGKSTLSEALVDEFADWDRARQSFRWTAFISTTWSWMLRGQRDRKGAPFTFDAGGFAALLKRLRAETGRDVAIPVFDRGLDLARAGGRIVTPDRRILIAEGNYLLLDQPPWRDMTDLFDMTVMLTADKSELRDRLVQRWVDHGLPIGEATARAMTNDIPNADLVINRSRHADIVLESSA